MSENESVGGGVVPDCVLDDLAEVLVDRLDQLLDRLTDRALGAPKAGSAMWESEWSDRDTPVGRARAHEAAGEYERVTAADGGEVTAVDVTTARLAAESIDLATLADLKADVDRTEAMLWRAEQAAKRAAMTSSPAQVQAVGEAIDALEADTAVEQLDSTQTQPEIPVEGERTVQAVPDPVPVLSPADAALLAKMEQDPIRLVPDAELTAFVDRAGRGRTEPSVVTDTEKLYARLDEQTAAIAAARELAVELRRITVQHETARAEHASLTEQLSTAKRRDRKTLEPAVNDARLRQERLERQVRDTQRAARDAAGRVQAETSEWTAIAARATDLDRRAADLASASVLDTAIIERGRRLRSVTLASARHAAEQRIRELFGTGKAVQSPPIDGVTDQRTPLTESNDSEVQENIAHLLADVPGPGRTDGAPEALYPSIHPDPASHERRIDHDHGL